MMSPELHGEQYCSTLPFKMGLASLGMSRVSLQRGPSSPQGDRVTVDKLQLLRPENSTLIVIDYQPQMTFGVQNIDRQSLFNNIIGLCKSAKTFEIPTILTTVETESFSGYMYPQILDIFPENKVFERTSMNTWDDEAVKLESQLNEYPVVLYGDESISAARFQQLASLRNAILRDFCLDILAQNEKTDVETG